MSEEFGPTFITLTDEEGNEFELEHIDTLEYNGALYMAFFPTETEEEVQAEGKQKDGDPVDVDLDEDGGLIILKVVTDENGEELLATLDSEEELEAVYDQFVQILFEEEDDSPQS